LRWVARLIAAELPEGLAEPDAAAAMDTLRDGGRDALGRDHKSW
jgi:hypothetical protein